MDLWDRHAFTLAFFRFVAIFTAEAGRLIGQGPNAMALLQMTGPVPHPVGPFNIWRGRPSTSATGPRPNARPSPRPMAETADEDADPVCVEELDSEYVEVLVDPAGVEDHSPADATADLSPWSWMRLPRPLENVEQPEDVEEAVLMQTAQGKHGDERLGRMLYVLQKILDQSCDVAKERARAPMVVVMEGRWTCCHAFTGARDTRFRTLQALLAAYGASSVDAAG